MPMRSLLVLRLVMIVRSLRFLVLKDCVILRCALLECGPVLLEVGTVVPEKPDVIRDRLSIEINERRTRDRL